MKRIVKFSLGLCLAMFFLTSLSAQDNILTLGQNSVPEEGLSLSKIFQLKVNVASWFLEDELYVGSSVSKVTEEEWHQRGSEKTFDAISHIPGVYVSEYYHGMQIPSFRGFIGPEQYNSFLYLLDGIPLNNYSSAAGTYGTPNFALGNLESIELIRGPGSALYGADAFNGVIALNTWSPDEDIFEAWAEVGSFGFMQQNTRFRHSFTDEINLTSALSLGRVNNEHVQANYHASLPGAPHRKAEISNEYQNITTSQKLAIENFELAAYYSRHEVEDSYGLSELSVAPAVFLNVNGGHSDGVAQMMAFKLSHHAQVSDDWELDSTFYHVRDELLGRFGIGSNTGDEPASPALEWDSKDHRYGTKFIFKKPFNGSNTQMLWGTSFDYMEVEQLGVAVKGSGTPLIAENDNRKVFGLLGQLEQRFFNDKLQVILGSRYDHYSDFGGHVSPRIGIIYHPMEDTALKLLYGNAFRAPSINEKSDNGIVLGGGDDLEPEQVDTYELIWMQLGDNWRYSITTYYSKVKDTIGIDSIAPGKIAYGNFTDSESYGLELEGSYQINQWGLYSNLSFNRAKQTSPERTDETYVAYPDIIFNAGVKYQPNDKFTIALNQRIHKGRETRYLDSTLQPSYKNHGELSPLWRTDLHLSWKPKENYELYLNVLDVFDEEDVLSSMNTDEEGRGTPGRRFTLGFKFTF